MGHAAGAVWEEGRGERVKDGLGVVNGAGSGACLDDATQGDYWRLIPHVMFRSVEGEFYSHFGKPD